MKNYGLNLDKDNRILSAFELLPDIKYVDVIMVDELPQGDISDYIYRDGVYIYEALPVEHIEATPTQIDVLEAQVLYTAMMTDTLLEV